MTIKKSEGLKRSNAIRRPKPIPQRKDSFGFEPQIDYEKRMPAVGDEPGSSLKRSNAIRRPKPIPQRKDSFGFEPQIDYEKRMPAVGDEPGSSLKRSNAIRRPGPNPEPRTKPDLFGFEQKVDKSGSNSKPKPAARTKPNFIGPKVEKPGSSLIKVPRVKARPASKNPKYPNTFIKTMVHSILPNRAALNAGVTSLYDEHGKKIPLYGGHRPSQKISRIVQQVGYQAASATRQISTQVNQGIKNVSQDVSRGIKNVPSVLKSHFVIGLKSAFFHFSMIALQILIQIYSEQKQINQVLNEEDTFEKKGLQTEKDASTHVISKYQIVQLKASDNKSFSVDEFKKELSTSVTGKQFVKWNLYTKVSKDYHWTVSPKPVDGKPFIGQYNTIIETISQPFYYYYEPSRDVTEKLLRYVGIPTLVNDQKKIEWFRFQLKFQVTASYSLSASAIDPLKLFPGIPGISVLGKILPPVQVDIKKLGDEYEAVWNDGDTSKKPLGLTIDQWLNQHGQEAEAYQAYLNPEQDTAEFDTEQEYLNFVQQYIDLLYVYLETVASDPASVYQYLQSITPPLEATVFEKVWVEYNQWRIQRGLLGVSYDNLEQPQTEPVETQSQIQQSNVIAGEGVTPLSLVFGSLYKEQNIRFERQFKVLNKH